MKSYQELKASGGYLVMMVLQATMEFQDHLEAQVRGIIISPFLYSVSE